MVTMGSREPILLEELLEESHQTLTHQLERFQLCFSTATQILLLELKVTSLASQRASIISCPKGTARETFTSQLGVLATATWLRSKFTLRSILPI